ncbi:hypothetical protein HOP52_08935 [Halomonas campisalis]|uniref:Uncharacterized protein n=1 Tax=Billgrantia campisalis TaxID=74661 RepID=A0ABS9P803_9GAMM|nr:DUF6746 family protein [Halomonas campisalis]MCG6657879.1 hypothetical protein [Halomonas campisalis]MDR5863597.1 hypothetical protein [Halomonas campisalis]
MHKPLIAIAFSGLLAAAPFALADEHSRIDHFEALPSETLVQAVANFTSHNAHLAAILEQETLSMDDLNAVHELTYTLEVALEKLHTDLAALADTLEEVHIASETGDVDGVRANGEAYLKTAWTVIR